MIEMFELCVSLINVKNVPQAERFFGIFVGNNKKKAVRSFVSFIEQNQSILVLT